MAYRVFGRVRAAAAICAVVATAIIVPSVASATPTTSPSDSTGSSADTAGKITSVQQRLDQLAMQNDQLVEKYNQATIRLQAKNAAASRATKAYRLAQHELTLASDQFSASAAAQYEGGTFSATGALLSSDSGSSYLDQLETLSMLSNHNAQTMNNFAAMQKQAKAAKQTADELLAEAAQNRKELAAQKAQTAAQIAKYKDVLASLNAQQRAILARQALLANQQAAVDTQAKVATIKPEIKSVKITSTALQKVVAFAIAQVGKPYVWGSGGPDSFDCSGLTMAAYAQAGIALPHSAANQYNYGTHVSAADLQPGDLLFYYSPIGHVAMYIGDGMMVSAPQTGENVKIIPADTTRSFTGATRLVG